MGQEQLATSILAQFCPAHASARKSVTCDTNDLAVSSRNKMSESKGCIFECLCGKCTIEEYLDGKCPRSSSTTFPYLRVYHTNLPKESRYMLEERVRKDTEVIGTEFADLIGSTSE